MVVSCSKCKVRLKVDETKLKPEGTRFRCPKCGVVLLLKRPSPAPAARAGLDSKKILIAHSNPETLQASCSALEGRGYQLVTSADGIDAMVKALKEHPVISIVEVGLPKIYGFELCKRLRARAETKGMKFILITSIYDKAKYRRDPVSLYDADEYIDEHEITGHLLEKVERLVAPEERPEERQEIRIKTQEPSQETPSPAMASSVAPGTGAGDEKVERAKRLARTIINDIYLYNSAKVEESIRKDNFYSVFATEVREGKKLYDSRISQDIRNINDFFREAIDNFILAKKKSIS